MNNQEYEQKKRECWGEYVNLLNHNSAARYVFDKIFDRAYALGKQFGNSEQVDADTVIQGWVGRDMEQAFESGANIFIGRQEKEVHGMCLSDVKAKIDAWMESHTEEEVYECLKKYNAVEDEGTVIQGWVACDKGGMVRLHYTEPKRTDGGYWQGAFKSSYLPKGKFPSLTWSDEPIECKILIKPKNR